jgi:reductive dehalogenase
MISHVIQLSIAAVILLIVFLFFLPIGHTHSIKLARVTEQVDERDIMFAREEYQPGTEKYKVYYTLRPENKITDDRIRALPELCAPGGRYYDPDKSNRAEAIFRTIKDMVNDVDGDVNPQKLNRTPEEFTRTIKDFALYLGADEVGIAKLNPAWVYSRVGRGPEPWGKPIENNHKYAIAFTLEMDYQQVEGAPLTPITEESARQYLSGASISLALAEYIRSMGYPARAHISGSNYQIMLPPVAYDAGLGELGRFGYLISARFGARVRLGAVTTDLTLIPDKPVKLGVQNFCESCKRCAEVCPSGSIPRGKKVDIRGVGKWPLQMETCFHYWRVIGTDCGLCMKVCPFSHPPNLVHNMVRAGIKRSSFARKISIYGEDLFYGPAKKYKRNHI